VSHITRQHFALNYSGCDAELPPPLCWTVPAANRAPAQAGLIRGGFPSIAPGAPHLMADPSDPATWQRPYLFST